jgi:hypothetical protein
MGAAGAGGGGPQAASSVAIHALLETTRGTLNGVPVEVGKLTVWRARWCEVFSGIGGRS